MPKDLANYRPSIAVFDPKKISGPRACHEASDTYFSADGKPLTPAGSDEIAIGRWELTTGDPKKPDGIHVDALADPEWRGPGNPEHGELSLATVFAGRARCLVTDRALRFTCYGHPLGISLEWTKPTIAFTVPLAAITSVDPGKSNAFMHFSWLKIELADLGTTISVAKAAKANEKFAVGVLSTNKSKEFAAQIEEARIRLRQR